MIDGPCSRAGKRLDRAQNCCAWSCRFQVLLFGPSFCRHAFSTVPSGHSATVKHVTSDPFADSETVALHIWVVLLLFVKLLTIPRQNTMTVKGIDVGQPVVITWATLPAYVKNNGGEAMMKAQTWCPTEKLMWAWNPVRFGTWKRLNLPLDDA